MNNNLNWKDIQLIVNIADKMIDEDIQGILEKNMTEQEYYQEILERYKSKKK